MRRRVDGVDFAGGHLADQQGAVLPGLAEKDALGLAAQRDAVADRKRVHVERNEFRGAGGGVERAEPEVAAIEEVVVVVPGPGHEAVDVAGAGDFLGEDVNSGDVGRAVTEDENLAGVAHSTSGLARRAAAGRAFRAAFTTGRGQQGHA